MLGHMGTLRSPTLHLGVAEIWGTQKALCNLSLTGALKWVRSGRGTASLASGFTL